MDFKPKNFDRWNEQDVREDIIAPLLKKLGYEKDTENDMYRGEHLRLKYYKEILGRPKKEDRPLMTRD
jgi:hypothetical protein